MHSRPGRRRRRGFALVTAAVCLVGMVAMLGLAVDVGRMYVVRNEAQAYADAASLAAALELDGTAPGISRAQGAVSATANRWNLGTAAFSGTQVDFGTDAAGPWHLNPSPTAGYRFVRVRASATLTLIFIPVITSARTSVINAGAVAGQVLKTDFREGVFPFSPIAHNPADPNYGFTPGTQYTLRWAANPKLDKNVCPGDNAAAWIAKYNEGPASWRGYIEENSASVIRMAIEQDYQTDPVTVGEPIDMSGGVKQTEVDALIRRVNQDSDASSSTYAQYNAAGNGNGRRLVTVPMNSGAPQNLVLGFGLFFLLAPGSYSGGGNNPVCAEYLGPYVQGSRHQGGGGPGAYVVRLVQ
jgi:Flp pilus assembly protein TadG